jgi:hypothetical protein
MQRTQIQELIDWIIDHEGHIDCNDVLIKAELINMRARPRVAGYLYKDKLYKSIDDFRLTTMNEVDDPKPLYYSW